MLPRANDEWWSGKGKTHGLRLLARVTVIWPWLGGRMIKLLMARIIGTSASYSHHQGTLLSDAAVIGRYIFASLIASLAKIESATCMSHGMLPRQLHCFCRPRSPSPSWLPAVAHPGSITFHI
jgi:hypothetical protein